MVAAHSKLPSLAAGALAMPHSGIREIINVAVEMPGCTRLEVGEPDFATPAHIVEAAFEFARGGGVRYTGTAGTMALREKLVAKLARVNGIRATTDQITVGVGGIGVIAAAFSALIDPGDEVLVPDPAWPCYELMLGLAKGRMVAYPCRPERGFVPDVDEVAALITPRTKMLVINSPCNPTGAVLPRRVIEALVALAERKGLYVLSDECYDQVVFEGEPVSPASFAGTDRVITAMSFSKTYAMTGWRVGYLVSHPSLAAVVNKVQESNVSCVSAACQKAAEAALDGPQAPLAQMVAAYRRRRDLCVEWLGKAGLLIARPGGAFYVMADVTRSGLNSRDFAFSLLRQRQVAVAPGTAFGQIAKQAVRISLASSEAALHSGIEQIVQHIEQLEARRS
jgi:aspartate aminotransferase